MRLFLNGTKVIEGWRDQEATPYSFTTTLTAGTLYDIELHYYEHEGNAECRLQWSYPGQSTQAIPQSQLYPLITTIGDLDQEHAPSANFDALTVAGD